MHQWNVSGERSPDGGVVVRFFHMLTGEQTCETILDGLAAPAVSSPSVTRMQHKELHTDARCMPETPPGKGTVPARTSIARVVA